MDNKVKFKINSKQKLKKDLILERQKTVTNCLDLECKNEQLKVLIDRLNNLANKRESLLLGNCNQDKKVNYDKPLFTKNSNISDEIKIAKENSKNLEKTISQLKNKINSIDKELYS